MSYVLTKEAKSKSDSKEKQKKLNKPTDSTTTAIIRPTKENVGLDPLFKIGLRLTVKDIFLLKCISDTDWIGTKEIFAYRDHVVSRIEIMGRVVRVDKRDKQITYAVDDGTGVINCTCWKNSKILSLPKEPAENLKKSLQVKLSQVIAYSRKSLCEGYELGDLVLMLGRVTVFRDIREISVMQHYRIDNPNAEVERMSILRSYYEIYNQPFTLPSKLHQQLNGGSDDGGKLFQALAQISKNLFTNPSCDVTVVTPKLMLSWPAVNELIGKMTSLDPVDALETLASVLRHLESTEGCVLARSGGEGQLFEVVRPGCPLAIKVIAIVQDACRWGKNAERGCHRLHVVDMLCRSRDYGAVPEAVVTCVLNCLESSSELIMPEPHRYMTLG